MSCQVVLFTCEHKLEVSVYHVSTCFPTFFCCKPESWEAEANTDKHILNPTQACTCKHICIKHCLFLFALAASTTGFISLYKWCLHWCFVLFHGCLCTRLMMMWASKQIVPRSFLFSKWTFSNDIISKRGKEGVRGKTMDAWMILKYWHMGLFRECY